MLYRLLALLGLVLMLSVGCDTGDDDDNNPPGPQDDDDSAADDDDDDTTADDDDDAVDDDDSATDDDDDDDDTGDDDDTTSDNARWLVAVFMNGDNDLEGWVTQDLNELEQVGSGDDVHVVVQADRIEGYSTTDGDWTGTRRYYITQDADLHAVSSTVLDDMGELDMGDPEVLSDFLLWAHTEYPADNMLLIMWNHGDGWSLRADAAPGEQGFISWDDTSGNFMSIAQGDLRAGLEDIVAARGPLDIVAFDACNMAAWEVAHSLRDQADYMVGSEATVGGSGMQYMEGLNLMRDVAAAATPAEVADNLAYNACDIGEEWTFSATDLGQMDGLASAIDALAAVVLADPSLEQPWLECRANARAADQSWHDYYLDIKDFATLLSQESDAGLAAAAQDVLDALDTSMVGAYGSGNWGWVGGLTIMTDTSPMYVNAYTSGSGATWCSATQWDDLLMELAGVN